MKRIVWYKTGMGEEEISLIGKAIRHECISMGPYTQRLEEALAQQLGVPYCVITPSGSVALFIALMAVGVGKGDEVIVPNRGWVAAAHAVLLAGGKVVLADVKSDIPIIDVEDVKRKTTARTKAIVPLHLNGRSADMVSLLSFARKRGIKIVEDACQALFSRHSAKFIGTTGDIGCFSLGMAKMVATGQGGFTVTRDKKLYEKLKFLRNHGVKDNFTDAWYQWGFNYKFTDVQAAMGLVQLKRVPKRIKHLNAVYKKYVKALKCLREIRIIPVDLSQGEIPLYIEVLAKRRDKLADFLKEKGIQTRMPTPDLDPTPYIKNSGKFPNSRIFSQRGLYLPGGPEQSFENIERVIKALEEFESKTK